MAMQAVWRSDAFMNERLSTKHSTYDFRRPTIKDLEAGVEGQTPSIFRLLEKNLNQGTEFDKYFTTKWSSSQCDFHSKGDSFRSRVAKVVGSMHCELAMTVAMVANLVLAVLVVDLEASGQEVPVWMRVPMAVLVAFYCVEVAARIFVLRAEFFCSFANLFDIVVVLADLMNCIFEVLLADHMTVDFAPLRVVRLIRLLRSAKILILFRSLYLLANGMASAMRAVFWALIMISFALVLCSIFAVVIIHPYVQELAATTDEFDGCARCATAYSSVWRAYMTFFQQVVAGDSWGAVTIPVMTAHPWTALFFIPIFFLIQVGLINMILAVIVDKAHDAREADFSLRLELKERALKAAQKDFLDICYSMDVDQDGELTYEEILDGYDQNPQFNDILTLMDIAKEDMKIVFNILDKDKSGTCTYSEFVDQLWKMKSQDSHTLLVFIKAYVLDARISMEESYKQLHNDFVDQLAKLEEMHRDMHARVTRSETLRMFGHMRGDDDQLDDIPMPKGNGKECVGEDANVERELQKMLRIMSDNIEHKLDAITQRLAAQPARSTCDDGVCAPQAATNFWFDGRFAQKRRSLPAAFCMAAEGPIVEKPPYRTPSALITT